MELLGTFNENQLLFWKLEDIPLKINESYFSFVRVKSAQWNLD